MSVATRSLQSARRPTKTDLKKLRSISDRQIDDLDTLNLLPEDPDTWQTVNLEDILEKKTITIRLDKRIVDFFQHQAQEKTKRGQKTKYQREIRKVLAGYVDAHLKR